MRNTNNQVNIFKNYVNSFRSVVSEYANNIQKDKTIPVLIKTNNVSK